MLNYFDTKLAVGWTLTKLDVRRAYEQMLIREDFLAINTHNGLCRHNVEGMLQGIPCVGVLLDNILITVPTDQGHFSNLETVLKHFSDTGLRLRQEVSIVEAIT